MYKCKNNTQSPRCKCKKFTLYFYHIAISLVKYQCLKIYTNMKDSKIIFFNIIKAKQFCTHNNPVFARVLNGELAIEPITPDNRPRSQQELLWRLFVVKSVINKSELINIKFIKKSCQVYQTLNLR